MGTVALLAPLAVASWKLNEKFSTMERTFNHRCTELETKIDALDHELDLKTQALEHINDKIMLSSNGMKEVLQHVRTRSQNETNLLRSQIQQVERYLAKTTDYEPRQ